MTIAIKNLKTLPWFAFLRWLEPLFPLYVLFASFYQLSYSQIFFTQIVFSLMIICFDLPLGVLGDLIGEEKILRFGAGCYLIAVIFLVYQPHFIHFCFAEAFLGLAFASFSGADTSLLFQSCQIEQCSYPEMESKIQALGRFAEGGSNIIAALLAIISMPSLLIGSISIGLLRLFVSFRFVGVLKPKLGKSLVPQFYNKFTQLLKGYPVKSIQQNYYIFVYSGLLSAVYIMNYWMMQIFLKELNLNISWIALINFVYFSCSALAAKQNNLIKKLGVLLYIILPTLLILPFSMLGLYQSLWELPLFIFAAVAYGFKMPFIYQELHRISENQVRTSFLSLDNVTGRILFSIISLPIGRVIDNHGLAPSYFILLGISFLLSLLGCYIVFHRRTSNK
jgi:hypothetical protein